MEGLNVKLPNLPDSDCMNIVHNVVRVMEGLNHSFHSTISKLCTVKMLFCVHFQFSLAFYALIIGGH